MESKTREQWLNEVLTKEEFDKAIKYVKESKRGVLSSDFASALLQSFIWKEIEEGFDYWYEIYDKYRKKFLT